MPGVHRQGPRGQLLPAFGQINRERKACPFGGVRPHRRDFLSHRKRPLTQFILEFCAGRIYNNISAMTKTSVPLRPRREPAAGVSRRERAPFHFQQPPARSGRERPLQRETSGLGHIRGNPERPGNLGGNAESSVPREYGAEGFFHTPPWSRERPQEKEETC